MCRRKFNQRLFRACRVEQPAHGGDAIGRNACALGVFPDGLLVRSQVHAVDLVAGHVAVEPLDLGTHSLQNTDRLLGNFPQLRVSKISGSRDFAFDDEFGHGVP
jgi:hypothetical protein